MPVSYNQHRTSTGFFSSTAQKKSQPDINCSCGCYPISHRGPKYFASLWIAYLYCERVNQFVKDQALESESQYYTSLWIMQAIFQSLSKFKHFNDINEDTDYRCAYYAAIWLIWSVGFQLYNSNILQQANDIETNPGPFNTSVPTTNKLIAHGNFHQGDERFSNTSRGNQCVINSVTAIMFSFVLHPPYWKSDDMDRILNLGDAFYRMIPKGSNEQLLTKDIPSYVQCFNNNYHIHTHENQSVNGLVNSNFESDSPFSSLYDALLNITA